MRSWGEPTVVRRNRVVNQKRVRGAGMVGFLLLLCLAGRLPADDIGRADSVAVAGGAVGVASRSTAARTEITLGGGLLFPVGRWAEGFEPGASVQAGFDRPLNGHIGVGGRISRATLRSGDRGEVKWLSMEAEIAYDPPLDLSHVEPFVLGRAGLLLAAVEVGEGREAEWDVLTGIGGGVRIPISEDFRFVGSGLWNRAFGGGQGFHFTGGLSFPLF